MHIIAVCPFCQTSYQVQPALRGQPIRCPNTVCRKVFTIAAEPASKTGHSQRSGSVGEMVPILPAAPATEATASGGEWWQGPPAARPSSDRPTVALPPSPPSPPAPVEAAWWRDAPPPARNPQAKTEPSAQPPKEAAPPPAAREQPTVLQPPEPEPPRELPPGVWEPPPVRRGAAEEQATQPLEETPPAETHQPRLSKRRARWLIAVLIAVPLVIFGGAGVWTWLVVHKSEAERFAEAKGELEQGHYGKAASLFRELAEKFPESEHAPEYRFLHDWATVCGPAADPGDNLADPVEKLDHFIKDHKKDPFMEQRGRDAGQLLLRLAKAFAERNAAPSDDKPLETAESIEQLRRSVEGLGPDALTQADQMQVEGDLGKVRAAVDRWRERRDVLSQLHARPDEKPFDALQRVRALLEQKKHDLPGLDKDAEVQAARNQLYEAHLASVVYQPHTGNEPERNAGHLDDNAESLSFDPRLDSTVAGHAPPDDPIVLALARGVLYALKQTNGELKWAMRVGIDTTALPLRVPRRPSSPELFLVLSADTQTLTALNAEGRQLWEYFIGQPVLGRPVVIDQRAYLAAYDGTVHEIELAGGKPLGRYLLGQRLTCGGAREGDSKRIYFPADDSCIYVLDVGQKRCVTILYDGHPSGSLRSEPIIIPPRRRDAVAGEPAGGLAARNETPGYLILNQANGLDAMRLRVFQLPLRDRHAAPLPLNPPAQMNGWTWFEPYHDGEKVAALSDAGILGLFGIRQVGNLDKALFPWLKPGGLDLSPFLDAEPEAARKRGRAQVVHMQENDLWVLAHGRLQLVQLLWNDPIGPQAVAGWPKSLALGSPLHAPQRIEERDGRSIFFLVTQSLTRQTCLASAVDDEGHILWQRQLGLVFQGEPLALTPPDGGPPLWLALDQSGGLVVLDPSRPANPPRAVWKSLAPALDDNPLLPPRLLPSADGHSAYEIAGSSDGASLIVRQIDWTADARGLRFRQRTVPLLSLGDKTPPRLAGWPAVAGSQLIVPMAKGHLARLKLPLNEEPMQLEPGPDWLSERAAPNAPCHVLALGGDRFLATDGSRGLRVWEWPRNGDWRPLPTRADLQGGAEPPAQPQLRVAAPMALLPAKDGQTPRVLAADSAGVLHLLTVSAEGALQSARTWDLEGKITDAPFVCELPDGEVRIGCLLDQRRLVWLDPSRPEPLWTYRTGGETIVGQPQMVEDMLVAALQSGRYLGLDPATGEARGDGYTLRASAAPAAAPVSFGPGRMLAPLSDGTALLLATDLLRQSKP